MNIWFGLIQYIFSVRQHCAVSVGILLMVLPLFPSPSLESPSFATLRPLQALRRTHAQPLLEHLHWLPVHQRIAYKLAILTYKVRSTGTPSYLSHHIKPRISTRHLRSSSHQLLQKPTTRTHFAYRAFRCTAPTVCNSLNSYTVDSGSLAVFKSRLKTFLFHRTFNPA